MLATLQSLCFLGPSPGVSPPSRTTRLYLPPPHLTQHICDSAARPEPRVKKAPGTNRAAMSFKWLLVPFIPRAM